MSGTLVCPSDHSQLSSHSEVLRCEAGHAFQVDPTTGIPTLFDPDLALPFHGADPDPLGRTPSEYPELADGDIDEFVQNQIVATGGFLYAGATLRRYPSPQFPLPPKGQGRLVDVGSGWGRWTFAAAHAGWSITAVDPWIENCRAAHRVARQLRASGKVTIVNGDGRSLPLPDGSMDAAFSYSVLQHLPKDEAERTLREMIRVVRPGGVVRVQMPNVAGLRQRMQLKRGLVGDSDFKVRAWTMSELEQLARAVPAARASISADGFLSLNAQWAEAAAMPVRSRVVVLISEAARRASVVLPLLVRWADSVWIDLEVKGA